MGARPQLEPEANFRDRDDALYERMGEERSRKFDRKQLGAVGLEPTQGLVG